MAVFTNQATLSYNDIVTSSNVVTGELLQVLSATKTALPDNYSANDSITYTVSIVNSGNVAYSGLTLTDDLGAYTFDSQTVVPLTHTDDSLLFYIDGILQATPSFTSGPPFVISGINIPAGANAILVYRAQVNSFAPLAEDATITNTVTISGQGIITPLTAEETIGAATEPLLAISKSISPSTVVENGRLTYTFIIENSGNAEAGTDANIVVRDLFDPILSDIQVTYNGITWNEGENYNYDEATGLFTTIAGEITVPAATYAQDPDTGAWVVTPGVSVLQISGNI